MSMTFPSLMPFAIKVIDAEFKRPFLAPLTILVMKSKHIFLTGKAEKACN